MPNVPTFASGSLLTANRLSFLVRPPIAKLRQTVVQTLANSVGAALLFDTETVDTDPDGVGGHSGSSSRYTARYPGWYQVSGGCTFQSNATGIRLVRWLVNGAAIAGDALVAAVSGNTTRVAARTEFAYLNIGDYVELQATQTCGVNLNTSVAAEEQSTMNVRWVSI